MQTELQSLSSRENWALFTLKGMRSSIYCLRKVPYLQVSALWALQQAIDRCIDQIEIEQSARKAKRKKK